MKGASRAATEPPPAVRRRTTRQLDATLRVLATTDRHPTAEQVFEAVRSELPATSRGTVYRNLSKLVAVGRARIVHGHGRAARYDARLDPHDHFVCTRCRLVVDVERRREPRLRREARVAGHRVEGRLLTYFGVCRTCEPAAPGRRGTAGDAATPPRG